VGVAAVTSAAAPTTARGRPQAEHRRHPHGDRAPGTLIRLQVEVLMEVERVLIYRGGELIATHARCLEPHAKVLDPSHRAGLWRSRTETTAPSNLASFGRDLSAYEDVIRAGGTR
jgi:hypothetical protein